MKFEWLLTLIFPHKCFLCGRVLSGTGWLCGKCALPETEPGALCPGCGKLREECLCKKVEPLFEGVTVPLLYVNGVCRGIHSFKYGGRSYYAAFLGNLMADRLLEVWEAPPFDGVTYVPMHPRKLRSRGYCQSALLAGVIARRLGLPLWNDLIIHTGNKRAQMTMRGIEARKRNASRSFAVPKDRKDRQSPQGARLLLVDDVITTCATVQECSRLLLELGAASVHIVAAATAVRKKRRIDLQMVEF